MAEKISKIKKAVYQGVLPIGDIELDCAVLEDGTRVLTAASMFTAFDRPRKGSSSRLELDGTKSPPFLTANNLKPFINKELIEGTNLIEFQDGARFKTGYKANVLPLLCEMYLFARREGALTKHQEKLAIRAEILVTAFARVGIDALVDEATGYQHERTQDALRILLSKYIAEGLQKWIKTFPDSFFQELDRLYGNEETISRKRPQYYGNFINTHIYDPIEKGYVKKELDSLNIKEDGKRKARFHQWLSEDGKTLLVHQIGKVEGLMEACENSEHFKEFSKKQKEILIAPYLFEEMNRIL